MTKGNILEFFEQSFMKSCRTCAFELCEEDKKFKESTAVPEEGDLEVLIRVPDTGESWTLSTKEEAEGVEGFPNMNPPLAHPFLRIYPSLPGKQAGLPSRSESPVKNPLCVPQHSLIDSLVGRVGRMLNAEIAIDMLGRAL